MRSTRLSGYVTDTCSAFVIFLNTRCFTESFRNLKSFKAEKYFKNLQTLDSWIQIRNSNVYLSYFQLNAFESCQFLI